VLDGGAEARIHAILLGLDLHAAEEYGHLTVLIEGVREDGAGSYARFVQLSDEILCLFHDVQGGLVDWFAFFWVEIAQ